MHIWGSLALMPRTNRGLVLFVAALFVFSLALFATAAATPRVRLGGGRIDLRIRRPTAVTASCRHQAARTPSSG